MKKKELITAEFSHEDNDFMAVGYPERLTGYCEYSLKDEYEEAEVLELGVYLTPNASDLLHPITEPIATNINLELYYNDFSDVIKLAKEKINEKYYDGIN